MSKTISGIEAGSEADSEHGAPGDQSVGTIHPAAQPVGCDLLTQQDRDDIPDADSGAAERERVADQIGIGRDCRGADEHDGPETAGEVSNSGASFPAYWAIWHCARTATRPPAAVVVNNSPYAGAFLVELAQPVTGHIDHRDAVNPGSGVPHQHNRRTGDGQPSASPTHPVNTAIPTIRVRMVNWNHGYFA